MVTIGQRRLGRKIRKLENSVEFSSKEAKAKIAEEKYMDQIRKNSELTNDSPVENLRETAKKMEKTNHN